MCIIYVVIVYLKKNKFFEILLLEIKLNIELYKMCN